MLSWLMCLPAIFSNEHPVWPQQCRFYQMEWADSVCHKLPVPGYSTMHVSLCIVNIPPYLNSKQLAWFLMILAIFVWWERRPSSPLPWMSLRSALAQSVKFPATWAIWEHEKGFRVQYVNLSGGSYTVWQEKNNRFYREDIASLVSLFVQCKNIIKSKLFLSVVSHLLLSQVKLHLSSRYQCLQ